MHNYDLMKKYILSTLAFVATVFAQAGNPSAVISIQADQPKQIISKHIYGHFAEHLGRCIYDGFWVDSSMQVEKDGRIRMDVVKALRDISIPNLRWPGGCYADEYQWRDGIGKPENRPITVNSNWGGVTEDNSFGTDEFMKLCNLLGCEPYLAANMGTGTPKDLRDWIEYLNYEGDSRLTQMRRENGHADAYGVSFFGIGNESWGCGGNMTPEYYADQYRQFQCYARNYSGHNIKKIASGANAGDFNWTEVCMKNIPRDCMWGLSLHYYTIPSGDWSKKGSSTEFDEAEYFNTMKNTLYMETLLDGHSAIMDRYDPERSVALVVDEWGIWTDVIPETNPGFLYQQNSMRDALIAGINLNLFNNHSERVRMANLAQAINVLQSLVLTDNEKMILTPTYYIFKMYKVHHDANWLQSTVTCSDYAFGDKTIPSISVSSSKDANGKVHVSITNIDPHNAISTSVFLNGIDVANASGQIITSSNYTDCNTFDNPNKIGIKPFNDFKVSKGSIVLNMPPLSVITIEIE